MEDKVKEILIDKSNERKKSLTQARSIKEQPRKDKICYINVFNDEKGDYEQKILCGGVL